MKKAEVKQLANKIVSAIIDALFKSCSPKKKSDTDLDRSQHTENKDSTI